MPVPLLNSSVPIMYKLQLSLLFCLASANTDLTKTCAARIVKTENPKCVIVVSDDYSRELTLDVPVTSLDLQKVNLSTLRLNNMCKPDLYLLVVTTLKQYKAFLTTFYRTIFWNTHGKFLILDKGSSKPEEFFKLSWEYYVLNVAVISKEGKIFKYFPFDNYDCGDHIVAREISDCSSSQPFSIFTYDLPKQFNNCTLRAIAQVYQPYIIDINDPREPGVEYLILQELTKRTNLSLTYLNHSFKSWGYKFPNGSFTLMYDWLVRRKTDVVIGLLYANWSYELDFDFTICYYRDMVTFFVPSPLQVPKWKNIVIVFTNQVWLAVLLVIILISSTWYTVGRVLKSPVFMQYQNCVFLSIKVLLSPMNYYPNQIFFRYSLSVWCLAGFVLTSTYMTILTSVVTRPSYEAQITTMAEMVKSRLSYGGFYITRNILNNTGNPVHQTIFKNWDTYCPLDLTCLNRTAEKRDFCTVKTTTATNYLIPKYYTFDDGRPKIVPLQDNVLMLFIRFFMVRGLPYKDRFNLLLRRMAENGLLSKWMNDLTLMKKYERHHEFSPLKLEHMKILFVVYFVGLGLASVAFLTEVCVHWLQKRKIH